MNKQPSKIAIVGGGIAGLSAAFYLQKTQPQASFTLFEKDNHLGGNIQTRFKDGFLIESGPDAFLFKPIMQELTKDLSIDQDLILPNNYKNKLHIARDGKLKKVPSGFYLMAPTKKLPFLFSNALSLPAKLRSLLEPYIKAKTPAPNHDESLASFVKRRFGKGNLDEITQAMVGGIYTADPEELSLKATLPRFIEFEKKYGSVTKGISKEMAAKKAQGPRYNQFRSFKNGMQTLIDAMEKTIPPQKIQKNALVQSIDLENGQWSIRTNGIKTRFDYLIMATPAKSINHLSNFLPTEAKRILKTIKFASCALVHLGYNKRAFNKKINALGMLIPQREKRHILASTFASQKFNGRAETDHVLLRAFMGGALNQEVLDASDEALIQYAKRDLKDFLKIREEPIFQSIQRWPHAMPQYTLGHQERIQSFYQATRNFENLCFVGNTFEGVGIPDLIERSKNVIDGIFS